MAEPQFDPNDPFADIDVATTPEASNVVPFTATQRLIVQNFFDNNKAARAKYLKQLGYEMNTKDDNLYRPIGSTGAFRKIDPGFSESLKKGGLAALTKEIAQDAGDIGYDMADFGAKVINGLGAGIAGTAAGGLGGIIAAPLAWAASGAVSNAAKQQIRDFFLDEEIPFDAKEMGVEALYSAAGGAGGKFLAKTGGKIADSFIGARVDAIKNGLKQAGSVTNTDIIEKAAMKPELFTKEAVEGGRARLKDAVENIFGVKEGEMLRDISDLGRIRPDSYFGKVINPMVEAQKKAVTELSLDPKASVPYSLAKEQLEGMYLKLDENINPSKEMQRAMDTISEQLSNLKTAGAKILKLDPNKVTDAQLNGLSLNHGQAREFLQGFQSAAFNDEIKVDNPYIRQAAGAMKGYLDSVAEQSGNEYGKLLPQVNAQMSNVLDDYGRAKELFGNSGLIMNAYVGGTTDKALDIKDFMGTLDGKYGTALAPDFDEKSAQAVFENIYNGAASNRGSSSVNSYMMKEFVKGAALGAGPGAGFGSLVPGVGTAVGAASGAAIGGGMRLANAASIANPEKGLTKLQKLLMQQQQRSSTPEITTLIKDSLAGGAGAALGSQMATQETLPSSAPSFDPEDPFADIE